MNLNEMFDTLTDEEKAAIHALGETMRKESQEKRKSFKDSFYKPNSSGVYAIINIKNNKRYIGQSENIAKRMSVHRHLLEKNEHVKDFQEDFNVYGYEAFIFELLEGPLVYKAERLWRESYWIHQYAAEQLYNQMGVDKEYGGIFDGI